MHCTASYNSVRLVQVLLSAGADETVPAHQGAYAKERPEDDGGG